MLNDYMGILNLNEDEKNIRSLTINRPIGSIPIYGRYRVIDFMLSNMVNSGIKNIGIFAQSNSRSLADHLETGKPWDLDRKIGGLFLFNYDINNYLLNDVRLLRNNMEYLYRSKEDNVIVSSSYMVCNIDLEKVVKEHENSKSDITMVYKKVRNDGVSFLNCDVFNLDDNGKVLSVGKNIGKLGQKNNISMEIFIMKKERLIDIIYKCLETGYYASLKDYIYGNLDKYNINSYEFCGYLQCINSSTAYYKANLDILSLKVRDELFLKDRKVYTKSKDMPPTEYSVNSKVKSSFIANGCIIKGTIKNSIISRGVVIEEGAKVKDSIILQKCIIKKGAKLNKVILDKNVVIKENKQLVGDEEYPLIIEKTTNAGLIKRVV
ncbi:glucose-1-phosphate adenylyltransferase subunit GlgD [Haloimpatiens sp. FM7330]|uniref:glucose-1-phosphate adenylyltransferase subunit GlgD n=1 Tax=Haloimpatiens sp. FM7330 TaxID=3298610 RepID=UPI00362A4578